MRIALEHVFFSYGDKEIFRDLSLWLPDRGILAVMGASGSGKTTLLRLLCGLLIPDAGAVHGLEDLRPAFIFQEDRLLPWFSALENLNLITGQAALSAEWLGKVGLSGWEGAKPAKLSGGMCRRVAIARALASESNLLLMDEPFKGLDSGTKEAMMALIRERCREIPGVLITHDREEANGLADDILEI